MQSPSFINREIVQEGLDLIFGNVKESVRIPDEQIKQMLSLIPITPNGITLLRGIMGVGKGRFTNAFTKVFFGGEEVGMLQCDPNKTQQESLYGTNVETITDYTYDQSGCLVSTHEKFNFDPHSMKFVTHPVKFGNEINRSSKSLQDTLLRLFEEGELEYQGKIFESARPFITIFDENPAHMQNDGRELEPALSDRTDICISMPGPNLFTSLHIQQIKTSDTAEDKLPSLLTYNDMKEVFTDIEKVNVPGDVLFWISCISQIFFSCCNRRDIANGMFIDTMNCKSCEFDNDICSKIQYPIGQRHIESIIKFSKSLAWLNGHSSITYEDALTVLPFTLNHRLILSDDAMSNYEDTYLWIKLHALPIVNQQTGMYRKLMDDFSKTIKGHDSDALKNIANNVRSNLIHLQVFSEIIRIMKVKSDQDLQTIEKVNLNTAELKDIKKLEKELKNSATFAIPQNGFDNILEVVTEITKSDQTKQHYAAIMDNRAAMSLMIKEAIEMYKRKMDFTHEEYARSVYPKLVQMCSGSNNDIDKLQETLSNDAELELMSVKVKVKRTANHVKLYLDADVADDMRVLIEGLGDCDIE